MMKRFRPFILFLVLLAAAYYALQASKSRESLAFQASGTIEAVEVVVAFEVGGQVGEVQFDEGDSVRAGDVLVRLDGKILQAQYEEAAAGTDRARADYQLIAAQPLSEQRWLAIASAQLEHLNAQQALEDLIENADLARANAEQELESAEQALEDLLESKLNRAFAAEAVANAEVNLDEAQRKLTILTTPPTQTSIDQAYANLLLAEGLVNDTRADIESIEQKLKGGLGPFVPVRYVNDYKKQLRQLLQNFEIKLSWDQLAYEKTLNKYNQLLDPVDPVELALAEAALALAEARVEQAKRDYNRVKDGPSPADLAVLEARIELAAREFETLKNGPDANDLALAQARVQNTEANLILAKADFVQEQLAVADAQVVSAQADLEVLQVQLDKLVLKAPVDGVVLIRTIEPGEVVKPGSTAMTLGLLDKLSVTIFIPAEYYSRIQLEDPVRITADSFPGYTFSATVIQIATESEFVYRNVGINDGHRAVVYPVVLSVQDTLGLLKPGMPVYADFGFQQNGSAVP